MIGTRFIISKGMIILTNCHYVKNTISRVPLCFLKAGTTSLLVSDASTIRSPLTLTVKSSLFVSAYDFEEMIQVNLDEL